MSITETSLLQKLLTSLGGGQVSDLHLRAGSPPVVRQDGELQVLSDEPIVTPDFLDAALQLLLTTEAREVLDHQRQITVGFTYANRLRLRVGVFYQRGIPEIAIRFISTSVRTLAELGLPPVFERMAITVRQGLVLIGGPFGSGRTTTIASFLQTINRSRTAHVVSIEEPIEYELNSAQSIIDQREIGTDVLSWEEALANLLAEDIDVLALGRLPSPAVAETAVNQALAGRLVIAGLEAESAPRAVEQLVATAVSANQEAFRQALADALQLVSVQRLVPRVGGGRLLVSEVLVATPAVRAVIREGKFYQLRTLMQTSRDEGMTSFDHALAQLVKTGEVMHEVATRYVQDSEVFESLVRR